MKVFISWSGEQSREYGEAVKAWLPKVLQAVKPFFSPHDLAAGGRWATELAQQLQDCNYGILVITSENKEAPWILYEAGALAKQLTESRVCPLLFNLTTTDLTGPLAQFNAATFDEKRVLALVQSLNERLGEMGLTPEALKEVFDVWWPRLDSEVRKITHASAAAGSKAKQGRRSDRELLEEILSLSRARPTATLVTSRTDTDLLDLMEAWELAVVGVHDSAGLGHPSSWAFGQIRSRIEAVLDRVTGPAWRTEFRRRRAVRPPSRRPDSDPVPDAAPSE